MNDLSLFLYAADVIEGIRVLLIFTVIFGGIGFVFVSLHFWIGDGKSPPHWKKAAACLFATALLLTVLPSKNTLYAIAASQLGEKVAETAIAKKALSALDAWLDLQINGKKP